MNAFMRIRKIAFKRSKLHLGEGDRTKKKKIFRRNEFTVKKNIIASKDVNDVIYVSFFFLLQ